MANLGQISFKNRQNILKNENDFYLHTVEEVVTDIIQQDERSKFAWLMKFNQLIFKDLDLIQEEAVQNRRNKYQQPDSSRSYMGELGNVEDFNYHDFKNE